MRKRPREGHRDWLWEVTINHLVISFNKDCLEFSFVQPYRTGFPSGSAVKNPSAVQKMWLITGSGRSPGGGKGNPFQYSCMENPKDRASWWATVERVVKSQT